MFASICPSLRVPAHCLLCGIFSFAPILKAAPANLESSLHLGFSQMEAETGTLSDGVRASRDDSGHGVVAGLSRSDWIGFERVFFEESGARSFEARIRTAGAAGTLAVRIGSPTGPTIGRVELDASEGWQIVHGSIWKISGIQPVYLALESGTDATLDWIRFQPEPLRKAVVAETTAAASKDSTEATPSPETLLAQEAADEALPEDIGEGSIAAMDPNRLEAEDARYSKDLTPRTAEDGTVYLDAIRARSWIMYPKIQYGRSGHIRIRLAHYARGDAIEIRLGSRHADPIARTFLSVNPRERGWTTLELEWSDLEPGLYDTYVVFRGTREEMFSGVPDGLLATAGHAHVNRKIAQLDWISLESRAVDSDKLTAAR